jgi:hypothetical protein
MNGTITTQSERKATGRTEHSNQTTPTERTAIRIAPELTDNDSTNVFIRHNHTTNSNSPTIPCRPYLAARLIKLDIAEFGLRLPVFDRPLQKPGRIRSNSVGAVSFDGLNP